MNNNDILCLIKIKIKQFLFQQSITRFLDDLVVQYCISQYYFAKNLIPVCSYGCQLYNKL